MKLNKSSPCASRHLAHHFDAQLDRLRRDEIDRTTGDENGSLHNAHHRSLNHAAMGFLGGCLCHHAIPQPIEVTV
jgi:hypothetical protein